MKIIVGLGNPGLGYARNRHNIGFMAVGEFAHKVHFSFDKRCCHSKVAEGELNSEQVVLARPQTYMNLSGQAVAALLKHYHSDTKDLIVVHDDLDLSLGRLRIRLGGSAGGHNGLKSIIGAIGADFLRLKLGIGRPGEAGGDDVIDHVLGDFGRDEKKIVDEVVQRAVDALDSVVSEGAERAMNRFNSLPPQNA